MSDKLVLVASFSQPVEAQLARGQLEAEGIQAFLTGDEAVNVFSGIGVSTIQLQVPEADAERAAALLAPDFEAHEDEADAGPTDDERLWLCPLCGDAVSDALSLCPACETPRPETRKSAAVTAGPRHNPASQDIREEPPRDRGQVTADTPVEAVRSAVEDDLDLPDTETFLGDDYVRRAFRLTVILLFLTPIPLVSLWMLVQLASIPGQISPSMQRLLYLGRALNVAALFLGLLLWTAVLFPFLYR